MRSGAGRLAALFSTPRPSVAVALSAGAVSAVQLSWNGGGPAIAGHAQAGLAPGLLTPSATGTNVADVAAVAEVLREVLARFPRRPTRVALVVPDSAAKVSIVRFETLPPRAADLFDLIRWRVGKTAPFAIDEAQIAYAPGAAVGDGGREFVVALMRRDVVETYEQVCTAAGAHAGVVDLAGFNLVNAVLAAAPASADDDWLLVHAAVGSSTLAIVRRGALVLYRNRAAADGRALADLVHQTVMYYQDRLGGRGFGRAVLAGESCLEAAGAARAVVRRSIEERLDSDVEWLGAVLAPAVGDRTGAGRSTLDALAAPIGALLRESHREPPRAAD